MVSLPSTKDLCVLGVYLEEKTCDLKRVYLHRLHADC